MTIKEYWNDFYTFSGKASDISRSLVLAGIAVIWIFSISKENTTILPSNLIHPLELFIATLAFDLAQYVYATIAWGIYCRFKEKELGPDSKDDFYAPSEINWPTWMLFAIKIVLLFWGAIELLIYMWNRICV
jgi:hypothetical protein